jgi:hypothetical protein
MKPPRKPEVRPLRRYPKPGYPSHRDPDPTQGPRPVPYPYSGALLAAVAGLGLGTSTAHQDPKKSPTNNPFTLALSGLPYQPTAFGTGQPERLSEELARSTIDGVFRTAGYELEPQQIDEQDLAFPATGYDAKRRVGYVFASYANLDDDARKTWGPALETEERLEHRVKAILGRPITEAEQRFAREALALPAGQARSHALKLVVERHRRYLLSLEEAKKLETREVANKRFIAVISAFDQRLEYWVELDWAELSKIPDDEERNRVMLKRQEQAARKALAKLEQSVREYIAWARSQGAL